MYLSRSDQNIRCLLGMGDFMRGNQDKRDDPLMPFPSVRPRWLLTVAAGALILLGLVSAPADGGFRDITEQAGLNHMQRESFSMRDNDLFTGGGAVGDFFGNGRNDLFITRHDNTDIFYMNMGDGTFEDRTQEVFGEDPIDAQTNGALLADLTNNGHLDLYVTTTGTGRHFLYINDGQGRLIEQGFERGAAIERTARLTGMSVTAGDFTGNGYLDLYISNWDSVEGSNRLLRNRGAEAPGYFEDVTDSAGVGGPGNRWGFGARFADMNRNGLLDLVPYNDFEYNQFFWNNGDGTFREASAETGTTLGSHEMGISVADFNNNGWMDIFLTDTGWNTLYRNEMHRSIPGLFFSERAASAGVGTNSWGWGAGTIDFDNNGWRDIVMVNGWMSPGPRQFFRNNGSPDIKFTSMAKDVGLAGNGHGRGVIVADFTGNGWQDILILNNAAPPLLYENQGGANDWVRFNLAGTVSNRQGIGARITVTPDFEDPRTQYVHEVNLEANFLSHNETTAHFGLGRFPGGRVDHVHVLWPSGIEQELFDVETNRSHTILESVPLFAERERFATAITETGLEGTDAAPDAVPFADGVENLLKYAFNMNLHQADRRNLTPGGNEISGLPTTSKTNDPPLLVIEFIRRKNSALLYTPSWSTDLIEWLPITTAAAVTEIDAEWERATVTTSLDPSARRAFGRVKVTLR